MSYEWTDDLLTKISWIDEQHKELFVKTNLLVQAFEQQKGKEEILHTLRFLEDYVLTHFRQEEDLQKEFSYPHYAAHKAMHDAFTKDLKKFKDQVIQNGLSTYLVFEVKEKLLAWIRNHIYHVDKVMADYLMNFSNMAKK
jgi:hemerythrin-like metal-binding protein